MKKIRTIGVLTSGGDAPGMNAAIRAVVRAGVYNDMRVMGIRRGYNGLISGDMDDMTLRSVSDIIHRGGTVLQTVRSPEFETAEGLRKAMEISKVFGLDAVVAIGGDGTYRGARDICRLGLPMMVLPGTIDNDIGSTEFTIGYDTALNTVQDAIDKIRDTAYSLERCSVVQVMGRDAGYIAINVGIAGGAEVVLVPERRHDLMKDVIKPLLEARNRGKKHYIVVVAEGAGKAMEIADEIEKRTGIETRATILGHLQRGGSPTARDRVLASIMGMRAVELLRDGSINRAVCVQQGKIVDIDLCEAVDMKKSIEDNLFEISRILAQ
ncbi:MAG: 6-phosphofructokinase [Eubacteriales bacterium]|nr:6-phosphofructokinase [Eubacteriales bacterium]